jgi:hypothetical protein
MKTRKPAWAKAVNYLLPLLTLSLLGCQTRKLGLPNEDEKFLDCRSDSSELLAITATLTARHGLGTVTGAREDSLAWHLHESAFLHWLRVEYGPGDRKASRVYLAWYRDRCGVHVKRRIGDKEGFGNPLGLSAEVIDKISRGVELQTFNDPARSLDQMRIFTSHSKYKELVEQFLKDVYPEGRRMF